MSSAVVAIVLAAATNSLVKTGISALVGGQAMGLRVGLPLFAAAAAGLVVAWLAPPLW